jgi:uncharacterized caspase-like protein
LRDQLNRLQQTADQSASDRDRMQALQRELDTARTTAAAREQEAARLRDQVRATQSASTERERSAEARLAQLEKEIADRRAALQNKEGEIQKLDQQIAALSSTPRGEVAQPRATQPAVAQTPPVPPQAFGRYHALLIGNSDYQHLPKLDTPVRDVEDIANVLSTSYHFTVTKLINADRYAILSTLNSLRASLTKDDNLLIYYAGHGQLDRVNQRGYWLPVDAELNSTANWISNIQITDIINAMSARQILVIADSCYSGTMTRGLPADLAAGQSPEQRATWIRIMIAKPSRMAMTSGGLEPVADSIGGRHSVFAESFLRALRSGPNVVSGQELYTTIVSAVSTTTASRDFHQVPEYAPMKMAGHEAGDFFFVRTGSAGG